jgi:hypothetical protein
MSLAKSIPDNIKRVSRAVGFAAWLNDGESWLSLPTILQARLAPEQRAGLAYAALRSLSAEQAEQTAAVALRAADAVIPPWCGGMQDARLWASLASRSERKAVALACFEAMSGPDQAAFFQHISEVELAA